MKTYNQFLQEKDSGPLAKHTYSLEDASKKHKVSLETLKKQLDAGIKVEREHTRDDSVAREIALDHIWELPDYYTRLKKVEKD